MIILLTLHIDLAFKVSVVELLVVDLVVAVELLFKFWIFDIEVLFDWTVRECYLLILAWTVRRHHSPVSDSREGAGEDEQEDVCLETSVEVWNEAFEEVWHGQDKSDKLSLQRALEEVLR